MSYFYRRDFLKKVLGAGALGGLAVGCGDSPQASTSERPDSLRSQQVAGSQQHMFKYAMCNESMQDRSWAEQCQVISNAGYTGVEIASFTLVEDVNGEGVQDISASKRQELLQTMQDNGLECVGLHWLLAPPPEGLHFTTSDEQVRQESVDYLSRLIDFCGDLNGQYMIFGSPGQRSTVEGVSVEQAEGFFAEGLSQVADQAQERGVKILVEPLSSDQTDVVNTVEEAVQIVQQIDHPAIRTMFDYHNTADETVALDELVRKYIEYIEHVHVQEMDGTYLGTGNAASELVDIFQVLKDEGYDQWVSLEVFDFSPGGEKIAEESMQTLQQIEAKVS